MRLKVTPPKKCAGCGDWMYRKWFTGGRREDPWKFERRRFHDRRCRSLGMVRPVPRRYCRHCGDVLSRRVLKNGTESLAKFKTRKFCSRACQELWREEFSNRETYSADLSRAVKASQRFRASVRARIRRARV